MLCFRKKPKPKKDDLETKAVIKITLLEKKREILMDIIKNTDSPVTKSDCIQRLIGMSETYEQLFEMINT